MRGVFAGSLSAAVGLQPGEMAPRPASPSDEAPLLQREAGKEGAGMPTQQSSVKDEEAVSELVSYVESVHRRVKERRQKVKDGPDEQRAVHGAGLREQATRKDH